MVRKGNVTVQCKFVFSHDILLSGKAYVTIKFTARDGLLAFTYLPIYSPSHLSSAACLSATFALICCFVSLLFSPPILVSIHTSHIIYLIYLTYLILPSIHSSNHPSIQPSIYTYGVELHLSRLNRTARHPDMQKTWINGFFFENRLHWLFEVRLLVFTVSICV